MIVSVEPSDTIWVIQKHLLSGEDVTTAAGALNPNGAARGASKTLTGAAPVVITVAMVVGWKPVMGAVPILKDGIAVG